MKDKKDKLKAKLPRGFKDNQEDVISLRNAVSDVIKNECQKYAFSEIDTSTIEYSESLGKFLPDSDRPEGGVFSFQDEDGQWLSLRYDLTAPLARYVAENYQYLNKPFKRYQTGLVFRNEKPGPDDELEPEPPREARASAPVGLADVGLEPGPPTGRQRRGY